MEQRYEELLLPSGDDDTSHVLRSDGLQGRGGADAPVPVQQNGGRGMEREGRARSQGGSQEPRQERERDGAADCSYLLHR